MKKLVALLIAGVLMASTLTSCGEKKKQIMIYASSEEARIQSAQEELEKKFPEYDIRIEYKPTGELSAKLLSEGTNTDADIIMELENSYLEKNTDSLATLDSSYFDKFLTELVPENHKYVPFYISGASIIINNKLLEEKGLEAPSSYEDLLKPEYKGLVSMPSPKTSGTGYIFLLNLVNAWGEDAAFEYFDKLSENISGAGFTVSGTGPMQAIKMNEVAIALGLTFEGVTEVNNGADYTVTCFEEGHPYTVYSSAVISGRETDEDVMKVFEYLTDEVSAKDKELFIPVTIFKDREFSLPNYPYDEPNGDMTGVYDISVKERLLEKWKY